MRRFCDSSAMIFNLGQRSLGKGDQFDELLL